MPSKNRNKVYVEGGCYHVFNRGVDKRKIFMDEEDYSVFLHLLKYYLSPIENEDNHPLLNTSAKIVRPRPMDNLHKEVDLLAFCLMPNHFHLLVKQITIDGMTKLLHKLSTIYSMYFNRRYNRVGHLFQGRYKAVLVDSDEYLLHLSRYIHLNPVELTGSGPVNYPYSSLNYYLGNKFAKWIKPNKVLNLFKNQYEYKKFVISYDEGSQEKEPPKRLFID